MVIGKLAAAPVLLGPGLGAAFGGADGWAVLLGGELCGEAAVCARDLPPNVASSAIVKAFQRRRFTVFPSNIGFKIVRRRQWPFCGETRQSIHRDESHVNAVSRWTKDQMPQQ